MAVRMITLEAYNQQEARHHFNANVYKVYWAFHKFNRPVRLKSTVYAAFGYVISLFPPLSQ